MLKYRMNQTLTQEKLYEFLSVIPSTNGGVQRDIIQKGGAVITIQEIRNWLRKAIYFLGAIMVSLSYSDVIDTISDINSGRCAGPGYAIRNTLGLTNPWCDRWFIANAGVGMGGAAGIAALIVGSLSLFKLEMVKAYGVYKTIENALVAAVEAVPGNVVEYGDEGRPEIEDEGEGERILGLEHEDLGEVDGGKKRSKKSRSKSKKSRSKSKKSRSKSKKRKTSKKTRRKKR